MESVATARMSSKGQIVIPEAVRTRLGLEPGDQFVVLGEDDVIILKAIETPSMGDFEPLVRRARQQARGAGMKRSDIAKALSRVRKRK
jgi:AbrB family looped-hinge helix DNA binding protein